MAWAYEKRGVGWGLVEETWVWSCNRKNTEERMSLGCWNKRKKVCSTGWNDKNKNDFLRSQAQTLTKVWPGACVFGSKVLWDPNTEKHLTPPDQNGTRKWGWFSNLQLESRKSQDLTEGLYLRVRNTAKASQLNGGLVVYQKVGWCVGRTRIL